jgi:hypothetical protein
MKKLKAFNQATIDIEFAKSVITELSDKVKELNNIEVSTTITINSRSSEKQYIYGISILRNQIIACEELGIDPSEYLQMKANVVELRGLVKELNNWNTYLYSLQDYKSELFALLSETERFQLMEYPTKP